MDSTSEQKNATALRELESQEANLYRSRSRIEVVEQIYLMQPREMPAGVENRWGRWLDTPEEQVFTRTCQVGEEFAPLETGWVEAASLVIVTNVPTRFQVMPTEAERAAADARVVELTCGEEPEWVLLPGETFRGSPSPAALGRLCVRCRQGKCKITVRAYPI